MKLKKLLYLSLLTAISLILFVVESQIPAPVPVPGVKLGLGNIIVVAVLFCYGRREALAVLLLKVLPLVPVLTFACGSSCAASCFASSCGASCFGSSGISC